MQAISRAAVGAWGSEAARSNHCFLEVRLSFGHSNSIPTTPVVSRIFDGVIFMDESRLERRLAATLSADVGDHSRRYTDAGLIRQWARSIGLAAAVGIAYFLAARLSLLLLTKPDGVAVFWPASGVAAGVLIALGPSARLPVAAGAMVATIAANLMGDRTLFGAVVFGLCNAGEALLTAWLIERYFGLGFNLGKLSHVLGMLVCAVVATAVSGIGGTAGFLYFHSSHAPILTIWQHWFASDALGIITVAPLIIEFASAARQLPSRRGLVEGVAALLALVILNGFVIFLPQGFWGCGPGCAAVSNAIVAGGPLPSVLCSDGCLH
jgi:MASE1